MRKSKSHAARLGKPATPQTPRNRRSSAGSADRARGGSVGAGREAAHAHGAGERASPFIPVDAVDLPSLEKWKAEVQGVWRAVQDRLDTLKMDAQDLSSKLQLDVEEKRQKLNTDFQQFTDHVRGVYDEINELAAAQMASLDEHLEKAIEMSNRAGFSFKFFSKAYLSRLAVVLVFLFCAIYLNCLASVIAGYRTPNVLIKDIHGNVTNQHKLPDLGHDLIEVLLRHSYGLDHLDRYSLPDELAMVVGCLTTTMVLFHPRRFRIIRRLFFIAAVLFLLRAFTVVVTSLPDASPKCAAQFGHPVHGAYKLSPMFPRVLYRAWRIFWEPSQHITCGDMIFSGHTSFLMLCGLVLRQYIQASQMNGLVNEAKCWLLRKFVYALIACGIAAILSTHFHYTLDVFLAIILSHMVWSSYHFIALVRVAHRYLIFMSWLEAEEVLVVEHHIYGPHTETWPH